MRARRLFLGMLAGNAAGALGLLIAVGLSALAKDFVWVVVYPSLFAVPFVVGLAAAWVWRPLNLRIGEVLLHSLYCTLMGLCAAWLSEREGPVCLLMAAPILYSGTIAGALIGRIWFRKATDKLTLCLAPLFAFVVAAEPAMRGPHEGVVADEILIAAPPAKVWPHVLAFPEIPDAPDYWLFRVGLPYPTETTNGGNFVGADRG